MAVKCHKERATFPFSHPLKICLVATFGIRQVIGEDFYSQSQLAPLPQSMANSCRNKYPTSQKQRRSANLRTCNFHLSADKDVNDF